MVSRVALHGCVVPVRASRPPAASSKPHLLGCGARARAGQRRPRSVAHVLTAGGPADHPWAVHMAVQAHFLSRTTVGVREGPGTAPPNPGAPPCSPWKKLRELPRGVGSVPWGGNHPRLWERGSPSHRSHTVQLIPAGGQAQSPTPATRPPPSSSPHGPLPQAGGCPSPPQGQRGLGPERVLPTS